MFLGKFIKNRKVVILDNFLKQFVGLMFHKKDNKLYLFEFDKECKFEVHSFFVFHELWLYFFDKNKKLIEKKILLPWRIYIPKYKFKYLIESFYEVY